MKFVSIKWLVKQTGEKKQMPKNVIENKKKEALLQVFFLKNDETQNVEVLEIDEVDLELVKRHLESGESVYIKRKDQPSDVNFIAYKRVKEPWYLVRS